jgi:hypothetical protein
MLRTVEATRYVAPLREGGSLPGLVEADDDGLYVLKFSGAGQGPKALVAEVLAGELARALGLPVPELVLVGVDPELGRAEPDPEIQDLIAASPGTNAGVDFLPGALAWSPASPEPFGPELAAEVVWFDALVTNVDRTARNPNLLVWHGRPWLIDHGAALYLQHDERLWPGEAAGRGFPLIAEHVLLAGAASILDADARLAARLDPALLERLVLDLPDAWLEGDGARRDERRRGYVEFLTRRLAPPRAFAQEAEDARRAA